MRPRCSLEAATHVPVRLITAARAPFPRSAASFWLDTLLVRALASPHPSDVWILPTDVCHPISIFPNCTRAHVARIGFWTRIQSIRGCSSVHADEPAAAGPLAFPQAIHLWTAWRSSPLTSLSQPLLACSGLSAERIRSPIAKATSANLAVTRCLPS